MDASIIKAVYSSSRFIEYILTIEYVRPSIRIRGELQQWRSQKGAHPPLEGVDSLLERA
jgi:hypothetical protein